MAVRVADELRQMNDLKTFPVAKADVLWMDRNKGQGEPDYASIQDMYNNDELGGGGSGGGGADNAEGVGYERDGHADWDNVKKALDGIIDKIEYVAPQVKTFTMSPSDTTYEVGQSITKLDFTWSYNKDVKTQSLTDVQDVASDAEMRSASWTGSLTSNKTFTLSASDGQNSASSSKNISFKHRIYWGTGNKTEDFDSAFILSLANKAFADNYKGKRAVTAGDGEYVFVACPAAWNMPNSCKIGGFGTDLIDCGTVSFENASGNTTEFKIVRTSNAGLGAIEMLFE